MMNHMQKARLVTEEVAKVILGKEECIEKIMMAILAGGHVLIEDIPGVGKTTLALAFAKAMNLKMNRVQFTPDVLPSDITGFSMYQKEIGQFVFHPGSVMCNLFLADEINRTSAKTQSALLEVMEEGAVTVDGVTHEIPNPFLVIATENPVGSAGTQMLPESQLDRFMVRVVMGYLSKEDETELLKKKMCSTTADEAQAVITKEDLLQMQREVSEVYVHPDVLAYIVELADATRAHDMITLGLSTRGALAVASMVKAAAYMRGRSFALPDDVEEVFEDVAGHRLKLNTKARMNHMTEQDVVHEILQSVMKPRPEIRYEK